MVIWLNGTFGVGKTTLDHLDAYEAARSWHGHEAHVIDTTGLQPPQVAKLIAAEVERAAARP